MDAMEHVIDAERQVGFSRQAIAENAKCAHLENAILALMRAVRILVEHSTAPRSVPQPEPLDW